jgi:hypothetical protein
VGGVRRIGNCYATVKRGNEITVYVRFSAAALGVKVMFKVEAFKGQVSLMCRKKPGNTKVHDASLASVAHLSGDCFLHTT